MKELLIPFFSSFVVMLAIDAVWLGIMSNQFYAVHIGHLMSKSPSLVPALVFYVIYIAGLTVFVLVPSIREMRQFFPIFLYGALFGLVAYGTYDLTNQATLKDWPVIVTFIDLLWGSFLTGLVSVISVAISKYFS